MRRTAGTAMIRTAVSVLLVSLFISSCSESTAREVTSTELIFKPTPPTVTPARLATVSPPPVPRITVPLANFKGMHDDDGRGTEDSIYKVCGWLYITEPYVNVLVTPPDWHPNIDFASLDIEDLDEDSVEVIWMLLPRYGTRYHAPSKSLWVWGSEPMTNGDYVCAGGWDLSPRDGPIYERKPWRTPTLRLAEPPTINPEETH